MSEIAKYIDPIQLDLGQFVKDAIDLNFDQYGGSLPADTPASMIARPMPLFIRKFIGGDGTNAGDKTFTFFDKALDAGKPFESNFTEVTLSGGKFFVITGISLKEATGAAAGTDNMGDLDFGAIALKELKNGLIDLKVNGNQEVIKKDTPISSLFLNDDVVPSFFRLPTPAVWRPSNSLDLEIRIPKALAATAYKYVEIVLWGFQASK